ncbi:MFS transporter [Lentzea sp. NPDC058436]|uniref:MFS transporter n=1 Tax=Lentzea sp. NPDC058436 TaxID=3346499 RepID=UPI0036463C7B
MATATTRSDPRLKRSLLTAFTLPTLVLFVMHGPEGQIQSIYAKHAGLSLTSLAAAVLVIKIFDAVTYPLIGHLSDRTHARRGSRKAWIVAGTVVSVLGVWMLLRPPEGVGVVYFSIWMATTYVGWKLMEIPLQAWSYGLSADYAQRSRVQAWRASAQVGGQFLFFAIPLLAVGLGISDSTELDFRSLGLAAIICAVALPLATTCAVVFVHGGTAPPASAERQKLSELFTAVRSNPPLLRLLAAFLPANLLSGMSAGVAYLYIDTYLGLSRQFPAIMATALLASIAGIPVWSALAARFERHRVFAVSMIAGGIACAGMALIPPGPLALPLVFVLYPVLTFTLIGLVVVYAMSADIVDYGRLVTGHDHAGLYGSLFTFLQKSLAGVSAAAGLAITGWLGFDATAASQTAGGILGVKLTAAVLPAVGMFCAAAVIWTYPLNRARVEEIQTELDRRRLVVERPVRG